VSSHAKIVEPFGASAVAVRLETAGAATAIRRRVLLVVVLCFASLLLWHFHDLSWYPVDEGNYAHVAERVDGGEILNLQVQDIHAGYINFLNAAAFRIFGLDLVSLRYPLALAALLQALLLYWLIARRDAAVAAIAAIGSLALGIIQFVNPTAHWYCAALTAAVMVWLTRPSRSAPMRLFGAGALVGVITLFRQLTGVWVGMAVLLLALDRAADNSRGVSAAFSRALMMLMLIILGAYVVSTREPSGAVLIALPPLVLLLWGLVSVRTSTRAALGVVGWLAAGAAAAAAPLLAYHVATHSMSQWFEDVVIVAAKLPALDFFGKPWYAPAVVIGLRQILVPESVGKWLNGWYWVALPLLPVINGVSVIRQLRTRGSLDDLAVPIIAAFYAVVSLHYQIPMYLYYSAGICLAAILWQAAGGTVAVRVWCSAAAAGLSLVAIVYHAAQPYSRTPLEILAGARSAVRLTTGFDRCSLRIDPEDRQMYASLVSIIKSEAAPNATILAVPSDAELYFLAQRRNAFPFYNTALGIQTPGDLALVLRAISERPPAVVTFRPTDKYNTWASKALMARIREKYDLFATVGAIEVYRLRLNRP
jgi:hypothetical protein